MVIKKKLTKPKLIKNTFILCMTLLLWLGIFYLLANTEYTVPLLHGFTIYEIVVILFLTAEVLLILTVVWSCISIPRRE